MSRIPVFLAAAALLVPLHGQAPRRKRVLAWADTINDFQHDSISHALATMERLGRESGAFETYIRTDSQLITKQPITGGPRNTRNLDYFDAFFEWPEFGEMIGGYFDGHPWGQFDAPIIVEDRTFPAMKHFPARFTIHDEIYQHKDFSRDKVHVLARLDGEKLDYTKPNIHRTDKDFPVAWTKMYGKGRVFYATFGHAAETWDDPNVQKLYLEATRWALRLVGDDVTK